MAGANSVALETGVGNLAELSPQQVGAAVSKLISATVGDVAVVFSRSNAHKHYSLVDLEWMILPAKTSFK
jgi:hemolysin-activating ACP:hemolysin acyltransferase